MEEGIEAMHSTTERSAGSKRPAARLFSLAVVLVTLLAAVAAGAASAQQLSAGSPSFYSSATLFAADFPAVSIERSEFSPAGEGDDALLLEMTAGTCVLGLSADFPITETIEVTVNTLSGSFATTAEASPSGLFLGITSAGDPISSVRLSLPPGTRDLIENLRIGAGSCLVGAVTATNVDSPGTPAMPGDTISYQIDVASTGPDPALDVVFDDTVDANTTLSGAVTTTPLARDDGLYEGHPINSTTVDGVLQPLLLDNDFGIPGTPTLAVLPVIAQATTLGGAVDINADGSFTYSPPPGATGGETDDFTYDVQNGIPAGSPATDSATASILLGLAPIAEDDALTVVQGSSTLLDAAADNGSGADDFGIPAGAVDFYGPVGGPLTTAPGSAFISATSGNSINFDASGNGMFTYDATVNAAFSGSDSFEYQISNSIGSDSAVVTVEVQAPPMAVDDGPAAASVPNDAFHTPIDTTLDSSTHATLPVLDNDDLGFPVADLVSYGTSASPTDETVPGAATATDNGGTVVVSADGNFVYTPPSSTFTGLDLFGYRLENAAGFDDGVVTIAVGIRPVCDNEVDPDDYDALGNVGITVPAASGVLIGDVGDLITVTGNTAPTSSGVAVVAADGSFTYTSGAGFSGGDSFTYTVGNGFGNSAACTVEVTVANTIWFIDNQAAGGGDGTLVAPFDSLLAFSTTATDAVGDVIFLDEGDGTSTDYDTGVTLLDSQLFIGQGVDLATAAGLTPPTFSDALPVTAGRPTMTNSAGAGITLASGNLATGLDVDGATGAGITGTNSAGATIDEVGLGTNNSDGMVFTNTTGTVDVNNLDVTSGATIGVNISGGSATFDFDSSSSIVSPTGTAFRINGGTATVTYSGAITQANNATAVSIANHSIGTVTFQTGTISATNGDGLQLSFADGSYNFNGTTTMNGGTAELAILNSDGTFSFSSATTLSTPGTINFFLVGGSADITFSGGITQSSNAQMIRVQGAHTGTVTFDTGVLAATNGEGLALDNADGTYNFNGQVTLNGGDAGIDILNGSSGGFVFLNTTITAPTNGAVNIASSSPNITYTGGSITQSSAATAYRANGNSGGIQNITVPITANTSTATGISLTNNTGAAINFTGTLDIDTTSGDGFVATGGGTVTNDASEVNTIVTTTGRGVDIDGTTIGAAGLTFQSVDVDGAAVGIDISGAGSTGFFTVTGTGTTDASGGTIQNTTQNGVLIANTDNITLTNMTLANAANDGGGAGSCSETVFTGCNAAVELNTVSTIDITNMSISTSEDHGIFGQTVTDFDISDTDITGLGADVDTNEHAIFIRDLLGTSAAGTASVFDNLTIDDAQDSAILIQNSTATAAGNAANPDLLTISNSTITDAGDSGVNVQTIAANGNLDLVATGNTITNTVDGVDVEAVAGDMQATVGGAGALANTFSAGTGGEMINAILFSANAANGDATVDATATNNTITLDSTTGAVSGLNGVGASVGGASSSNLGTIRATIDDNTINSSFSGVLTQTVHGVLVDNEGTGTTSQNVISIDNNQITLNPAAGSTTAETVGIGVDGGASGAGTTVRATNNTIVATGDASNGASVGIQILPTEVGDPTGTNNRVCVRVTGNDVFTPNNPFAGAFDTTELDVIAAPVISGSFLDVEAITLGVRTPLQLVGDIEPLNTSTEVGDTTGAIAGVITGVASCPN